MWRTRIHAVGTDDEEIIPPTHLRECGYCHTCYEHTLKTQPNPLLERLNEALAPYAMFGVFSLSGNLLPIPDTRKDHIKAEGYPHIFCTE